MLWLELQHLLRKMAAVEEEDGSQSDNINKDDTIQQDNKKPISTMHQVSRSLKKVLKLILLRLDVCNMVNLCLKNSC